ncbi:unnamed protein product [Musa textilis]
MASIIPSFFGRKTNKLNAQEPLSGDIWEPLGGFSFATTTVAVSPHDTAHMDWKETPDAHVFITDLPGVRKEEVNVEVEEKGAQDKRAEGQGERGERGQVAPRRAQHPQVLPDCEVAARHHHGWHEGEAGERGAHCDCAQGARQEGPSKVPSD